MTDIYLIIWSGEIYCCRCKDRELWETVNA